jgi:hypothetical protein
MTTAVEDVLAACEQAETLLETLPPLDPDHETVRLTVVWLRATYQTLTLVEAETTAALAATRDTLYHARALLSTIRAKRERGSGTL